MTGIVGLFIAITTSTLTYKNAPHRNFYRGRVEAVLCAGAELLNTKDNLEEHIKMLIRIVSDNTELIAECDHLGRKWVSWSAWWKTWLLRILTGLRIRQNTRNLSSAFRYQTLLISYHRITYETNNQCRWDGKGLSQVSQIIYKFIERISA